jgi:hypothetical protein
MKALVPIAIALVALVAGCRGCEPAAEAPQPAPAPEAAAPPAEQAPPAAQQAPAAEEQEEDCFVILDASPDYGPVPLQVEFTADVECTAGEPKFTWEFGDGSPKSNEPSPKHTYTKPGEYPASVVVTGPRGGTDSDELDILVEEP